MKTERLRTIARARRAGLVTLALIAAALAVGCRKPPPPDDAPPYETLLMLVADFRRSTEVDLYREDPPQDLSGQNAFRAMLAQLDHFERTRPNAPADVVDFARGEALARLGEYAAAVAAYERVEAMKESPLAEKAKERIARLVPIRLALSATGPRDRLSDYFAHLEQRRARLAEIEKEYAGSFDAMLARRELEQADVEYAVALFRNRYVRLNGAKDAIEFVVKMLERHSSSRLIYAHHLLLGQFYAEQARDLATLRPPDRLHFDMREFTLQIEAARKQFQIVSLADGYEEKLEAAALLQALDAFARKVRKFSQ